MRNHRVLRVAAVAVTLAATAPAVAAAAPSQDLRSPDARDAAANRTPASGGDLRSPDVRDAAAGRVTADAPAVVVVPMPSAATEPDGMDWADAGIGAGGTILLVAAALAGGVSLSRRRHGVALGRRVGSVG
jgi:hypothetical protein